MISSFRLLSDGEAQTSLIPGGWGCVALIRHGLLRLYAAQPKVSSQQPTQHHEALLVTILPCKPLLLWCMKSQFNCICALMLAAQTANICRATLAIPTDDLQPVVVNVPEGLVTAAALGWGTAVALSEPGVQAGAQAGGQAGIQAASQARGKLYECRLASIQTPDSSSHETCQQVQNVPITWCRLPLLRPVTAVAVGEHHR